MRCKTVTETFSNKVNISGFSWHFEIPVSRLQSSLIHHNQEDYVECLSFDWSILRQNQLGRAYCIRNHFWIIKFLKRVSWKPQMRFGKFKPFLLLQIVNSQVIKVIFSWIYLGWIPGISGFSNSENETWIWITQIIELQKSFEMIPNSNQFPWKWNSKFHFGTFAWAFG